MGHMTPNVPKANTSNPPTPPHTHLTPAWACSSWSGHPGYWASQSHFLAQSPLPSTLTPSVSAGILDLGLGSL